MKLKFQIVKCLLIIMSFGGANLNAQIPFSEDFTNTALNRGWIFQNPNPDSTIQLTETGLNVTASWQNGGSDLFGGNFKASRLLQPVDPSLDWIIETKFDFAPGVDYQAAGLLLAKTSGDFDRDTDLWRYSERAFFPAHGGQLVRSGGPCIGHEGTTSYFSDPHRIWQFTETTCYLRLQKSGTNYSGWWSADGVEWNSCGTTGDTTPWPYIGVFVICKTWSGVPVNSSANFHYFHAALLSPAPLIQTASANPALLSVTSAGATTLNIQIISTNQVVLSWPANTTNFILESTNALFGTNQWQTVTDTPTLINDLFYITNNILGNDQFYRLRQR